MAPPLNPSDYTIVPHLAILDEFQMVNDDGSFSANITPVFLDRLCDHMNEREQLTGDLSPIVIGHTKDQEPELTGPPVVGFARNWHRGVLGATGRQAAFADAWIKNEKADLARSYPRRSAEVWTSRFEIDPISLLGATTPARDLGLMRLSREGSVSYSSPEETIMPDEKKKDDAPAADPKNSGESKGLEGKLDQLLSMMSQFLASQPQPGSPPMGGAPGEPPGGEGGEPSDADLDALIASLGGGGKGEPNVEDKSRKAEPAPVQNDGTGYDPVRMSRLEAESAELRTKLARSEVRESLTAIRASGKDVDPNDEALVADLIAQPPDMRVRTLERLTQLSRPLAGRDQFGLQSALSHAVAAPDGRKQMTAEDKTRLSRLAVAKKTSFDEAARAEGYTI